MRKNMALSLLGSYLLKKKKQNESLKIFSRVVPLAIFPITTPVVCNCMVDIAR